MAPQTLALLEPVAVLLPVVTPVNLNTATREVMVAAIDNIDPGSAERLVQARQRKAFVTLDDAKALLALAGLPDLTALVSDFFVVFLPLPAGLDAAVGGGLAVSGPRLIARGAAISFSRRRRSAASCLARRASRAAASLACCCWAGVRGSATSSWVPPGQGVDE